MKIILAIAAVFFFLNPVTAFADLSIKAEVDKTELTTDEALTYKLSIVFSGDEALVPEIPKFEDFSVISQAESTQFSFGEGMAEKTFIYSFVLMPKKKGEFTIKPTKIKINGREHSSDSFKIKVSPGKIKRQEIIPETDQPQITL